MFRRVVSGLPVAPSVVRQSVRRVFQRGLASKASGKGSRFKWVWHRSFSVAKPQSATRSRLVKTALPLTLGILLLGGSWIVLSNEGMVYADSHNQGRKKQRVVVLGTGFAALSFVREIDPRLYEVVLVSPENYFLFTPLLPSATVGTVETRSICEPIRKFCRRAGRPDIAFYEAACIAIDPKANRIVCEDASPVQGAIKTFELSYDYLVVAVGSVNNTFGVEGVKDHCLFLKTARDVNKVRDRIMDCFETANIPGQPEEALRQLLSFVVVGGGPTGVEFAAELHDFIQEDLCKWYPHLMKYCKITLIQSADHLLNAYSEKISDYAQSSFSRQHTDVRVNTRVLEVHQDRVKIQRRGDPQPEELPFGMCLWSTGITQHPLVKQLAQALPKDQTNRNALLTDKFLLVKGTDNIYAVGDCATIEQKRMLDKMSELFAQYDTDKDGQMSLQELKVMLNKTREEYPQLSLLTAKAEKLFNEFNIDGDAGLSLEEFKHLLTIADSKLKSLPATGQVASQEGAYLGEAFNRRAMGKTVAPFVYHHLGSLAYIGSKEAVMDLPGGIHISGLAAWFMWRSAYLSRQRSFRNMVLVAFDWTKTLLFGRDITRV